MASSFLLLLLLLLSSFLLLLWLLLLLFFFFFRYSMRGLAFKDLGLFEQAEHDLRKAIELAPLADAAAYTNLGIINVQQARQLLAALGDKAAELLSRDDRVKVEALLTEAARYASTNPRLLMAVGDVYMRIGKQALALVYLRRVLELGMHDAGVARTVQILEAQLQR